MERQYLTIISRITKMRFLSIVCFVFLFCNLDLVAQQTETQYLSGTDKDHTVDWDFYCTGGRNSGKWTKIPVPSNWELKGFGTYNYGKEKNKSDEKGLYKYQFEIKPEWKKKRVFIVFEGSMTDTKVKINGKLAGPIHQGAFYRFKYEIGKHLNFKEKNLLEVEVAKKSADTSVNRAERDADFWVFGGIFRPVYLEAVPEVFIENVSIASANEKEFDAHIFVSKYNPRFKIIGRIETVEGKVIFDSILGYQTKQCPHYRKPKDPKKWTFYFENLIGIKNWNPEDPHLYKLVVKFFNGKEKMHEIKQPFGFRTVKFREKDGFYVNGTKVKFKGVNRHTFWPDAGQVAAKESPHRKYHTNLQDAPVDVITPTWQSSPSPSS
jgi:beta-galactosidase/beta-glucuronidase